MNKQELIKIYENTSCTLISINGVLEDLRQLDEPEPIKLKDVIKRIEKFDLGTKAVWINEILYKLGSDYGMHKYYTGYKQGKFDGAMERGRVTIPQFVADWIEYCKEHNFTLFGCLDPANVFESLAGETFEGDVRKCIRWCRKESNNFARAWLDGYTVEKEKQYEVILCNGQSLKTVYRQGEDRLDFEKVYGDLERFTRKQLVEAGFGWVFDCPGIEIEEVE